MCVCVCVNVCYKAFRCFSSSSIMIIEMWHNSSNQKHCLTIYFTCKFFFTHFYVTRLSYRQDLNTGHPNIKKMNAKFFCFALIQAMVIALNCHYKLYSRNIGPRVSIIIDWPLLRQFHDAITNILTSRTNVREVGRWQWYNASWSIITPLVQYSGLALNSWPCKNRPHVQYFDGQ